MKLRIPVGVIVVAAVLLLVIAFSSCSNCQKFVPYSANSVWSTTGTYHEGMATNQKPIAYSSYPTHTSVDVMDALNVENTTSAQGSGAVQPPGVRLWGFGSNLFSSSDNDKSIDIFGPTPGATQCFNRSFGLTKSTGPLCITDEQYNLLTTRGGGALRAPPK